MPDKRIIMHTPDRRPQYFANQTQGIPVGWCSHNKHRGKLSVRQMKQHKCLGKQCMFFTKNEKHNYWKRREQIKKNKRDKRREERLMEYMITEIRSALDEVIREGEDK